MGKEENATLTNCEIQHFTDKAVLVEYEGDEVWIPLSQVDSEKVLEHTVGDIVDIDIPEWLAIKKGLV